MIAGGGITAIRLPRAPLNAGDSRIVGRGPPRSLDSECSDLVELRGVSNAIDDRVGGSGITGLPLELTGLNQAVIVMRLAEGGNSVGR